MADDLQELAGSGRKFPISRLMNGMKNLNGQTLFKLKDENSNGSKSPSEPMPMTKSADLNVTLKGPSNEVLKFFNNDNNEKGEDVDNKRISSEEIDSTLLTTVSERPMMEVMTPRLPQANECGDVIEPLCAKQHLRCKEKNDYKRSSSTSDSVYHSPLEMDLQKKRHIHILQLSTSLLLYQCGITGRALCFTITCDPLCQRPLRDPDRWKKHHEEVATNRSSCEETGLVMEHCPRTCHACGDSIDFAYDVRRLPKELKSVAWMVGRWRSEFGGKALFPTIPKFTYGEQIDISISDVTRNSTPSLNYTAFAWDISVPEDELVEIHSESGYINVNRDKKTGLDMVSLTTAMSNGACFCILDKHDDLKKMR
ncbi:unnamed protein product [Cylicocyclus nassatus]|uniref:THAP4-like heme-binding domain-containing protein n=1 Tax=Cylicocyclus nassatus TaxID=53992 RepID=A0AA36GSV6_CYLNA|nr:unnamed protein product [Cylicocyclus nassatus]